VVRVDILISRVHDTLRIGSGGLAAPIVRAQTLVQLKVSLYRINVPPSSLVIALAIWRRIPEAHLGRVEVIRSPISVNRLIVGLCRVLIHF
jgi:hypothetical protein